MIIGGIHDSIGGIDTLAKPTKVIQIANFVNELNAEEIDVMLKALALRMCELGHTDVIDESGIDFTCRDCQWVTICDEINDYLRLYALYL